MHSESKFGRKHKALANGVDISQPGHGERVAVTRWLSSLALEHFGKLTLVLFFGEENTWGTYYAPH